MLDVVKTLGTPDSMIDGPDGRDAMTYAYVPEPLVVDAVPVASGSSGNLSGSFSLGLKIEQKCAVTFHFERDEVVDIERDWSLFCRWMVPGRRQLPEDD